MKTKNKLLVVLALMAVICIIFASCNKDNGDNTPAPDLSVGEEMGVYYYDVEDGEFLLTLSVGKTFTLTGIGDNKTGTYTIEGNALNFDFLKDEDGTATATLNGKSLALTMGETKMNFLKKVNYTVNFEVNGGSAMNAVSVVNGKTVAVPADPTKDSNVFLGWYADKAFTTPYDFTAPIIEDTTVYAKWVAVAIGTQDFTVDFDLGYEATAPASLTTIAGKLYATIPTPEREGYTFGGWWISMSNDADKLSYAYTADTVFTQDTTLFALWIDNAETTVLSAPKVNLSANQIKWDQVSGAKGYILTVVAPDGTLLINESLAATAKAFNFATYAAGEYTVTVVAVAEDEANNSETTRVYLNKALDRVSGFQVVNGQLIFNPVGGAQKYIITVDCGNDAHVHVNFDNGNKNTFDISKCPMQKGGINITVTAMATGYASSTATYNFDLTLGQVANVVYDATKDAFIWDAVAGAAKYIVTVTTGENTYTIDNGGYTTFSAAAYSGEITVSVVPVTFGYNSPEGTEATCTKTAPGVPSGLGINGMLITWAEAAGAVKYEIKINGELYTAATNSFDISTSGIILAQGQIHEAAVRAISAGNEASVYSETFTFGYYAMVDGLSYSKNTVTWAPVLGVDTFRVRVNGGKEFTVVGRNYAKVTLTKEGENIIEVKYVSGDDESQWTSITVNAVAVEYDSRSSFGTVLVEYLAIGDTLSLPGAVSFSKVGYDFVAWATTPMGNIDNGMILSAGATFEGSSYTVLYATWNAKCYNVILSTNTNIGSVTNIAKDETYAVTFNQNFALPVPKNSNSAFGFAGWYTHPNGEGRQITDGEGNSLAPFTYDRDTELYPYFTSAALSFYQTTFKTARGVTVSGYGVRAGEGIATVSHIVIPESINGKPVVLIDDNAFNSYASIITLTIPNTVQLIGQKAFRSATNLQSVEVYDVDFTQFSEPLEVMYSSANGALLCDYYDDGNVYLECVPKAVGRLSETGTFVIPEQVVTIKPEAFRYCNVEEIIIPNNVLSFPDYAFKSCTYLKVVTFEAGRTNATALTKDTFVECGAVEIFNFPANIEFTIDELKNFLTPYKKLKQINVEAGNENYATLGGLLINVAGDTILYAPKGYQGVVTIPSQINTIDENAFAGVNGITEVVIPIWVKTIGKQAFYNSSITKVTFMGDRANDLTITQNAFRGCKNLESVTFGESIADDAGKFIVSQEAFYGGPGYLLETITIKSGTTVSSLGSKAFAQQPALKNVIVEEGAALGTIGANAFENCTALGVLEIPASVTSIGQYAFSGCTALYDLTFDMSDGAGALSVSTFAFNGCTKLRSVVLPDRLGSFNSAAFEGCIALKSITVNDTNPNYKSLNGILYKKSSAESDDFAELLFYPGVLIVENNGIITDLPSTLTKIGGSAFSNNGSLISVTLPAGITAINTAAFKNCYNLTTVIFLGVTDTDNAATAMTIGESAFAECKALNTIVLPSYTTSIGKSAFENCVALETLTLPEKLTTIGATAFHNAGLVNVTIPANVTSIGQKAFFESSKLESVTFTNAKSLALTNTYIFASSPALTTVDLGSMISTVGANTFDSCGALQTVTISGTTLTKIDNYAFRYCTSLTSINIPSSVTTIGNSVFACKADAPGSLENITFDTANGAAVTLGTSTLQYQPNLKKIDLPAGSKITTTSITTSYTTASNPVAVVFTGCSSLEQVNIATKEGVTNTLTSVDGVLYTADMKVAVFCPAANSGHIVDGEPTYAIEIPNTVTLVLAQAFANLSKIETITFAEFDKEDANYGKQLLSIGQAKSASSSASIFGGNSTSIKSVSLPSHLKDIRGYAFAINGETVSPMTITFNMDASNIILYNYAFAKCGATKLAIPGVDLGGYLTGNSTTNTFTPYGEYAFAETTLLEEVTFASFTAKSWSSSSGGTKTEVLPRGFFQNATALTTFTIPSVTKTINMSAFSGCTALTSISIPTTVTKVNQAAFMGSGLTSITLHSNLKTMSNQLFKNCKSLKSVTFQGAITSIALEMFFGCSELTTLNFSSYTGLTKIDSYAFMGCEKLISFPFTSLTKITSIGNNAFSHTGIKTVDLSAMTSTSYKTLGNSFNNMPYLEKIVFAPNWTALPTSGLTPEGGNYNGYQAYGLAFDNCPSLKTIVLNAKFNPSAMLAYAATAAHDENGLPIPLFDYVNKNCPGLVIDTSKITTYVKDDAGVFYSSDFGTVIWAPSTVNVENYVINELAVEINANAFLGSSIGTITIPRYVEYIGENAFLHATSDIKLIDTATEPSYLYEIGAYAFAGSGVTSFVIPDVTESVGDYTFAYAMNLKSLTTGTGMGKQEFTPLGLALGVVGLEELVIKEGPVYLEGIFSDAWQNMAHYFDIEQTYAHALKTFVVPASVEMIDGAFVGMNGLETVSFAAGSKLTTIAEFSFAHCTSLVGLENLPNTIVNLGDGTFYNCSSLKTLDLSGLDLSGSDWYGNYIGEHTFAYTTSLESIVLPDNIEAIHNRAFYSSGLLSIEIPASVEKLGLAVFEDCTRLTTVVLPDNTKLKNLVSEDLFPEYPMVTYPEYDYENSNLFRGTTSLETITIPNSFTTIDNGVFENSGLQQILMIDPTAKSSLTTIGDRAFAGCTRLTLLGYVENPGTEDERVYNYFENVVEIGEEAFAGCTALTAADFGDGLVYIGNKAFANCNSLEKAYLPASVIELGGNPFEGIDVDKIEVDPMQPAYLLETALDGTVYLKDASTGEILGTWAVVVEEPAPEAPAEGE